MGKLGTYKIKRVRAFLLNKLGIDFRQGKEPFGYYILDGRRQLKVSASNVHGGKELGKGATKGLMRELLTSNDEFDALYECPWHGTDYEAKIRKYIDEGIL
jgi:hypothetical protein